MTLLNVAPSLKLSNHHQGDVFMYKFNDDFGTYRFALGTGVLENRPFTYVGSDIPHSIVLRESHCAKQ